MRKIVGVDFIALMPMPTPVTAILAQGGMICGMHLSSLKDLFKPQPQILISRRR